MIKIKYPVIIILFFVSVLFVWIIARPYRISGDCMEPAIIDGRLYFSNQLAPYIREYKIGDIIVFKYEDRFWISRIVALENSTIQIKERKIIINDKPLNDDIIRNWQNWDFGMYAINKPLKIPNNHVFVLSDNLSAQHDDSRVFGPINKSAIVGLVW